MIYNICLWHTTNLKRKYLPTLSTNDKKVCDQTFISLHLNYQYYFTGLSQWWDKACIYLLNSISIFITSYWFFPSGCLTGHSSKSTGLKLKLLFFPSYQIFSRNGTWSSQLSNLEMSCIPDIPFSYFPHKDSESYNFHIPNSLTSLNPTLIP